MLLHRRVVRELKRLLPDATYYRAGHGHGMFCLPDKQRVFVRQAGPTTVEVRTKLLITRGHPLYGFDYDGEDFHTTHSRVGIAEDLGVLLAPYTEDTAASSPNDDELYY